MYPLVYFSNLISRVLKTKLLSFYSNSGHYLCISYSIYLYICIHTHTHTNGYICWYMIFIYIYMGMLKPKLQHFGHLTRQADSSEKTLMLGGEGVDRGQDGWMASSTPWTWVWASSGSDGQRSLECCSPWGRKELDRTDRTERLNNNNG